MMGKDKIYPKKACLCCRREFADEFKFERHLKVLASDENTTSHNEKVSIWQKRCPFAHLIFLIHYIPNFKLTDLNQIDIVSCSKIYPYHKKYPFGILL